MKKTTKKVQDTGAVKVIPPYPRWVKICFALVWVLLIVVLFLVGVLEIKDVETAGPVFGLFLLTLSVVSGYGIYRAFRYFPRRAFCVLALLVIVGGILLLLPAVFQRLFLRVFFGSRSIIFLVLGGLIVGQGILALFWKKAQKLGCFIFYIALSTTLAITGQIYDYVTRVPPLPRPVGAPLDYTPRPQVVSYVDCYESGIVALQINPDESITIINKGVLDTQIARLKKGAFEVVTFNPEDTHSNIVDDHGYDYTKYLGVKNGKAIIERVQGHHGPGGMNSYENVCPFEIAPFTLVDYANTPEKEQEVWFGIAHLSQGFTDYGPPGYAKHTNDHQMIRQFMDHWAKSYGETELKKIVNQIFLSSGDNMALKKLLLDVGADVNAVDSNGENALFHLVKGMNSFFGLNVGVFLISNGLDLYHKNNQGQTVIDILKNKRDNKYTKYVIDILKCAANPDAEVMGNNDFDYSCRDACPQNSFRDRDGQCVSCDSMDAIKAQENECYKCGDRRFMERYRCVLSDCGEGVFRDKSDNCVSCFDIGPMTATAEECAKCVDKNGNPIREMYGKRCGLIECPEGMFQASSGDCVSCSEERSWSVASAEECAKCMDVNGNPIREMYGEHCSLIECPKGMFHDYKGECVSCSSEKKISSTAEECAKCVDENGNPIREIYKVKNGFLSDGKSTIKEVCGLINCPEGNFTTTSGTCVSCFDIAPMTATTEECAKCVDDDGNPTRKIYKNHIGDPMFDNRCGLINCPQGQFPVVLGGCMPCTHLLPEPVESAEACAACQDENGNPTRRMYKGTFNHPDVSDGCGLIECPKGMFLGKFGHCISCSDAREYDSTAEECAKCSDSRTYNSETQKCELKV